jgi:hypothetical protein
MDGSTVCYDDRMKTTLHGVEVEVYAEEIETTHPGDIYREYQPTGRLTIVGPAGKLREIIRENP